MRSLYLDYLYIIAKFLPALACLLTLGCEGFRSISLSSQEVPQSSNGGVNPAGAATGPTGGVTTGTVAVPTYYVDFAAGSDKNSGTTASSPWMHAPGDPNATGNAAGVKLNPGDMVLFRPGVVYRGSINVTASGAIGKPIIYEGTSDSSTSSWGAGQATLSGLTKQTLVFIPYNSSSTLSVATLPTPIDYSNIIQVDGVRQWISAYPDLGSNGSDPNQMDAETIPFSPSEMQGSVPNWTLTDSALAKIVSAFAPETISNTIVRIYDNGNWNNPFSVTGFTPSTGELLLNSTSPDFSLTGLTTSYYHLFNNPALITAANQYAVESNGTQLIAYVTPGMHVVEQSLSGVGFNVYQKSYVTVDGFNITAYSGNQTAYYSGIGILISNSSNINVTNNSINNISMWSELYGGIFVQGGTSIVVNNNDFGPIFMARGVGFGGTQNMQFSNNHVHDTGGTSGDFYSVQNAVISFNRVDNEAIYPGSHAEGFAIYDNSSSPANGTRNVQVLNNQLLSGDIIFAGATWSNPLPANVLIANNLLIGSGIFSQGRTISGVTVKGNIALLSSSAVPPTPNPASQVASAFTASYGGNPSTSLTNLTAEDNIFDGTSVTNEINGSVPSGIGWIINNNTLTYQYDPNWDIVLPGNVLNTALRPTLVSALLTKGQLPASVCAILEPDGTAVQIGIDYYCTSTTAQVNAH